MTTTTEVRTEAVCDECGSHCSEVNGQLVCTECGLVHSTLVFAPFASVQNSFVVPEALIAQDWTQISTRDRDGKGNRLNPVLLQKAKRLRRSQARFCRGAESRLFYALLNLNRFAAALRIPRAVHVRAATILRSMLHRWTPSRYQSLVLACILYAAREHEFPLTPSDILAVRPAHGYRNHGAMVELRKAYFFIQARIGPRPGLRPEMYLSRLATQVGASAEVVHHARQILHDSQDSFSHTSRNPVGLAAAALWLAGAGYQKAIAHAVHLSVKTISESAHLLRTTKGGES